MTRKKAAAIKYDKSYGAPIVTAIGFGDVAEKIVEKASENNIPVVEDTELVNSLSTLNIGDSIPQELYEAVAEIIAFIYSLNSEK